MKRLIIAFFFSCFLPLFAGAQTADTAWIDSVVLRFRQAGSRGDVAGAEKITIAALDTARIRYGNFSPETADMLLMLAGVRLTQHNLVGYEQTMNQVLEVRRKVFGEQHILVADGMVAVANARNLMGRTDSVELLLAEARRRIESSGEQGSFINYRLAVTQTTYYNKQGAYLKAEQSSLEAFKIINALNKDGSLNHNCGVQAGTLGAVYESMGQFDRAIQYYDTSMIILKKYSTIPKAYLTPLRDKGTILTKVGRYGEAESILKEALAGAKKLIPPGNPELSYFHRSLGVLYSAIGRYKDALLCFDTAAILLKNHYGEAHPESLNALLLIATTRQRADDQTNTDSLYRTVIRTMQENGRQKNLAYAKAVAQLGASYQRRLRFDESRPLVKQCVQLAESLLGQQMESYWLEYGLLQVRQFLGEHQPDSALLSLAAAREPIVAVYGERHRNFITLEILEGQVWQDKGDAGQALKHFKKAFEALQTNLSDHFAYLSMEERENFARTFETAQTAFLHFARAFPEDADGCRFLYDVLIFQKELRASYDRQLLAGWQQNSDTVFQNYLRVRQMLANQMTLPASRRLDLPVLEAQKETLEKQLSGRYSTASIQQVTWQQVQHALLPADAAIEWVMLPADPTKMLPTHYGALLLRSGRKSPLLVLLPEVTQADALFAAKGSRGIQYATRTYTGDALYQLLWKPLEKHLGGVQRIFYAPTGALHLLNFEALSLPGRQLLADRYQLVRVNNTARLTEKDFGKKFDTARSALLMGGLDYEHSTPAVSPAFSSFFHGASSVALWRGGEAGQSWASLPQTLTEVKNLAALLGKKAIDCRLMVGSNGGETALKTQCSALSEAPAILHFATHGFFFEKIKDAGENGLGLAAAENPMYRSGLILAGANPAWRGDAPAGTPAASDDDGILTAEEVSLLNLGNTALVVLSACETGLGDVRDDEGVYGLQRAFRLAGARNVVMSLWRVPDAPTREFMEQFYAALLDSGDVRAAFARAQGQMRRAYGNPYYWAGFILLE